MSHAPTVLVLQHIACEPPAAYGLELDAHGLATHTVRLDQGQELPDWRPFHAILAMGGPMGAYDQDQHPWLVAEQRLIADAVHAGTPFWGVCLGAQLLAAALGAAVAPGPAPEIGVDTVTLTPHAAADPVFAGAPHQFPAFHWHGDTYQLPHGAVHLASSASYPQQAFAYRRAYALQFHLEVTPQLIAQWGAVPAYAAGIQRMPGAPTLDGLLAQAAGVQSSAVPLARRLFARWLVHVAGTPARPTA